VLQKLEKFVALFLAVEVTGPDDRDVVGKPVVVITHKPTLEAYQKREASAKLRKEQGELVGKAKLYYEQQANRSYNTEWTTPMPHDKAPANCTCGVGCPAREFNSLNPKDRPHEEYLDTFCADHRPLVDAYLLEHPDAWPPKESS
jgi:hypothetical protein